MSRVSIFHTSTRASATVPLPFYHRADPAGRPAKPRAPCVTPELGLFRGAATPRARAGLGPSQHLGLPTRWELASFGETPGVSGPVFGTGRSVDALREIGFVWRVDPADPRPCPNDGRSGVVGGAWAHAWADQSRVTSGSVRKVWLGNSGFGRGSKSAGLIPYELGDPRSPVSTGRASRIGPGWPVRHSLAGGSVRRNLRPGWLTSMGMSTFTSCFFWEAVRTSSFRGNSN